VPIAAVRHRTLDLAPARRDRPAGTVCSPASSARCHRIVNMPNDLGAARDPQKGRGTGAAFCVIHKRVPLVPLATIARYINEKRWKSVPPSTSIRAGFGNGASARAAGPRSEVSTAGQRRDAARMRSQ
jgi:hypothetical protein